MFKFLIVELGNFICIKEYKNIYKEYKNIGFEVY